MKQKIWIYAGCLFTLEVICQVFVRTSLPKLEKTRAILAGEETIQAQFQRSIGQPYLLYTPRPRFIDENGLQHNKHGYRGPLVSLRRGESSIRILTLGGSTTYGWRVAKAEQTYPARLQALLSKKYPGVAVEVINGGLPYGTTAEILTHYHYKFHYYRPDIVIINTGGNDGVAFTAPYYQPDYSHWRRTLPPPRTYGKVGRWILKSRLASIFIIPITEGFNFAKENRSLMRPGNLPPDIPWYIESIQGNQVSNNEIAFRRNLDVLIDIIKKDGAKVLLVPYRIAPGEHYPEKTTKAITLNEAILYEFAKEKQVAIAPFPLETISPQNWLDDCHLNAEGSAEKAAHLLPYVQSLIDFKAQKSNSNS